MERPWTGCTHLKRVVRFLTILMVAAMELYEGSSAIRFFACEAHPMFLGRIQRFQSPDHGHIGINQCRIVPEIHLQGQRDSQFAGSWWLAAWVVDCGVFRGREDGQATEFDGGHRRPDAGDPVAELSARMPGRHCKMKRLWKRTATTGLSVVGKAR